MSNHKSDFLNIVKAIEKLIRSDSNEAKKILLENGIDPKDVRAKGRSIIDELVMRKSKSSTKRKKFGPQKWQHESVIKLINESEMADPIEAIKERARSLVLKGFENGWAGPPYSPLELAKLQGINLNPDESVQDASISSSKKGALEIQYNPFQKPTRINFSVAHEIAHSLFSDCSNQIRNREEGPKENWELEFLCNIAASEILLPYGVFANEANSVDLNIESLMSLSNKYEASLGSVFLRFPDVVDKDCAIAVATFNNIGKIEIDYFKPSNINKLEIPRGYKIPTNSKVYECKSPGWTDRDTEDWDVFEGIKQNVYAIGLSPLKREKRARVGILFVPFDYKAPKLDERKIIMEIGDATKPRGEGVKIIAQPVNTSGGLGFGFGKSLSKNYPIVKSELEKWSKNKKKFQLGASNLIKINDELYIFQMLAQKGLFPKGQEIPLKYSSLRNCLVDLANAAITLNANVHMPQIGIGMGRGDWGIILEMIHDELINRDVKVSIYTLPGTAYNSKFKSNLTIFKEDSTWQTGKLF